MKLTFEYNDDEKHIVKWCLFKCATFLGTNDGENDPIEYKNKVSISNVWNIPLKFQELFMNSLNGG